MSWKNSTLLGPAIGKRFSWFDPATHRFGRTTGMLSSPAFSSCTRRKWLSSTDSCTGRRSWALCLSIVFVLAIANGFLKQFQQFANNLRIDFHFDFPFAPDQQTELRPRRGGKCLFEFPQRL